MKEFYAKKMLFKYFNRAAEVVEARCDGDKWAEDKGLEGLKALDTELETFVGADFHGDEFEAIFSGAREIIAKAVNVRYGLSI